MVKVVFLALVAACYAAPEAAFVPPAGVMAPKADLEMSRMQSQAAAASHTHFAAALDDDEGKAAAPVPPVAKVDDDEGKAAAPVAPVNAGVAKLASAQGPTPGSEKLSTAGKCYLALATLFFIVNAIIYLSRELTVRGIELPQSVLGDIIFNQERLNNSKVALVFIPVLSVLMLFVMFRARIQNLDGTGLVPPMIQNFMVVATMGIYMQALDVMDIRITSDAFGNLSEKIGMLFVYVGYGGVVYGLFTAKDPNKPVSVAAQNILALCTLVFALQILVKYLQNKSMLDAMVPTVDMSMVKGGAGAPAGAPGAAAGIDVPPIPGADLMKGMFDETKLAAAITTCEFVPLVAMVFMYLHLLTVSQDEDARPPEYARNAMYGGAAGIYLQTAACILLKDINKTLGTVARSVGLLITYAGFIVTLVYALSITPGELSNVGVLGMLYMVSAVLVFKAANVALEEIADTDFAKHAEQFQQYKEVLAAAGQVLQYATILGILMIYIHFRAKIILGINLPDWVTFMELTAMICLFLQVCMVLLGGALGESTVTAILKGLTMLGLYIGFGGIVSAAFLLERN